MALGTAGFTSHHIRGALSSPLTLSLRQSAAYAKHTCAQLSPVAAASV